MTSKHLLGCGLAALGLCTLVQAAPVQWTLASGGNGHWYEFVDASVTWDDARAGALLAFHQGQQGYLATATSAEENTFAATIANGTLAWLGANDNAIEGEWRWADGPEAGQLLTYFNWNSGEPNNCCGGENHLQTNYGSFGLWNDHGGPGNAGQVNGYLIEYANAPATVPVPATPWLVLPALLAAICLARRRA